MITDNETNFLYLSDQLCQRQSFFNDLTGILFKRGINFGMLPHTKDIWSVDYMPVQKSLNSFIQFRYEPDYLQTDQYIILQSDPNEICNSIGIPTHKSILKIDGGNIIKGKEWVILTDKIFKENADVDKSVLISDLEGLFEVRVIIIPRDPDDYTGHADGILRYFDNETVLINHYRPGHFQKQLKKALREASLKTIDIPYNTFGNDNYDSADGLYINFLQMENFILIPSFNRSDDERVFRIFEELFRNQIIEIIDSREVSKDGGVLNCITWNIKLNAFSLIREASFRGLHDM